MSIPETRANLLVVRVEGRQILSLGLAGHDLKRATQARDLGRSPGARPCPPVAQIAVMNIIGSVGGDIRGQTSDQVPILHRIAGNGSWRAQFVTWEETADVNLLIARYLHLVIAVARHQVLLGTE